MIFPEPEGRLRLRSVDDALGIREPRPSSAYLRNFYETWIYAECPRPRVWFRRDAFQMVAEGLLRDYFVARPRGIDVLWGYGNAERAPVLTRLFSPGRILR